MDTDGEKMNTHGYIWIQMKIHGDKWIHMDAHEYT